jgi:hypothetical protein
MKMLQESIDELEAIVLIYVEKYGPTERVRSYFANRQSPIAKQ